MRYVWNGTERQRETVKSVHAANFRTISKFSSNKAVWKKQILNAKDRGNDWVIPKLNQRIICSLRDQFKLTQSKPSAKKKTETDHRFTKRMCTQFTSNKFNFKYEKKMERNEKLVYSRWDSHAHTQRKCLLTPIIYSAFMLRLQRLIVRPKAMTSAWKAAICLRNRLRDCRFSAHLWRFSSRSLCREARMCGWCEHARETESCCFYFCPNTIIIWQWERK